MAAAAESVDIKLFCELKDRFPDLPEPLVTYTVKQHHNNRNKCLEILDQEKIRLSAYCHQNYNNSSGSGLDTQQLPDRLRNLYVHCDRPGDTLQPPERPQQPQPPDNRSFMFHSHSDSHLTTVNSPASEYPTYSYNQQPQPYNNHGYASARFNAPQAFIPSPQHPTGYNQYQINSGGYYNNPLGVARQQNYDQNGAASSFQQHSFKPAPPQTDSNSYHHRQFSQQQWQNSLNPVTTGDSSSGRPESAYTSNVPYGMSVHDTSNAAAAPPAAFNQTTSYMSPLYINTSPESGASRPQYLYTQNNYLGTGNRNDSPLRQQTGSPVQQSLNFNHHQSNAHHKGGIKTPGSEPGTPTSSYASVQQGPHQINNFFPPVNTVQQQQQLQQKLVNVVRGDNQMNLLTSNDPDLTKVTQQPIQPSPASSLSSLNSVDGQRNDGKTSRSNSAGTPDDIAYTQALLLHQRACFERLRKEFERERVKAEAERLEVEYKERELLQRKLKRSNEFPTPEDVAKFRDENRRLQVDIEIMTREIDHYNNGQAPLGVLDPIEQQSFYSNMSSTGQSGPLRIPSTNTLEALAHQNPPAPPPPPDPDPEEGDNWNCSACTFLNHPALDKCECCDMPRMTLGIT
ncbi:mitogen-activated protein kinase kinase kinase 7-interacting protein 3 homolog [Tubulanus polymorphus]|uniref:mitogen-activated protein kinase kinase kinase 7-interacting protein 3 homolog n=1 Tax=Tubulanus polymorphus TaxID=672921 RepID=UPI003DA215AC